jgi:hypothetical protein
MMYLLRIDLGPVVLTNQSVYARLRTSFYEHKQKSVAQKVQFKVQLSTAQVQSSSRSDRSTVSIHRT